MRKYFLRYENLLPILTLVFFWGFDLYLVIMLKNTRIFSATDYMRIALSLCLFFIILSVIPYYFYFRIRKNVITGTRLTTLYFPFSAFLLLIAITCTRFAFALFLLPAAMYLKISGGIWTSHDFLNTLSEYAVVIYLILQIIFIIDTVSTIKRVRRERQEMIEQMGQVK